MSKCLVKAIISKPRARAAFLWLGVLSQIGTYQSKCWVKAISFECLVRVTWLQLRA